MSKSSRFPAVDEVVAGPLPVELVPDLVQRPQHEAVGIEVGAQVHELVQLVHVDLHRHEDEVDARQAAAAALRLDEPAHVAQEAVEGVVAQLGVGPGGCGIEGYVQLDPAAEEPADVSVGEDLAVRGDNCRTRRVAGDWNTTYMGSSVHSVGIAWFASSEWP